MAESLDLIREAIVDLEALRDSSTPGPWRADVWRNEKRSERTHRPIVWRPEYGFTGVLRDITSDDGVYGMFEGPDAEMIVRLRASLDAQLAILRDAEASYWEPGTAPDDWESFDSSKAVLSLAAAILGASALVTIRNED